MNAKIFRNIIIALICVVSAVSAGIAYIKPAQKGSPEDFIVFYETEPVRSKDAANQEQGSLVSINTGTIEELMTLPSIGEVKAKAIIAYREEYGEFVSIEELTEVKGIGSATLEKLKDKVKL